VRQGAPVRLKQFPRAAPFASPDSGSMPPSDAAASL
jgi:hypothetical protein